LKHGGGTGLKLLAARIEVIMKNSTEFEYDDKADTKEVVTRSLSE